MISTVTNQGRLRFLVFTGTFPVDMMLGFLRRLIRGLIRGSTKKILLIDDHHPVHQGRRVQAWLKKHQEAIREEPLPT